MDENETTSEPSLDEETDFGPFAVAAVALISVGALGAVAGRNYERVKENIQDRLAVRKSRKAIENRQDEEPDEDE